MSGQPQDRSDRFYVEPRMCEAVKLVARVGVEPTRSPITLEGSTAIDFPSGLAMICRIQNTVQRPLNIARFERSVKGFRVFLR